MTCICCNLILSDMLESIWHCATKADKMHEIGILDHVITFVRFTVYNCVLYEISSEL
jgi:hypothetical protein